MAAANLRLAGLRYVSEFPSAEGFLAFWETTLDGPLFAVIRLETSSNASPKIPLWLTTVSPG